MTLEDLFRLETMHAEVHPAAPAEIHQWFPEMAKALREAWAALDRVDEAMAEVQRLRVAIARFVAQYPWQDGPEIQELKALKEG